LILREDVPFSSIFFYLSYIFVQSISVESSGISTTITGTSQFENCFDVQFSEDIYSKYIHSLLNELNTQSNRSLPKQGNKFSQGKRGVVKPPTNIGKVNTSNGSNLSNGIKRDFYTTSSSFLPGGFPSDEGY
jgi:hypothetical protein